MRTTLYALLLCLLLLALLPACEQNDDDDDDANDDDDDDGAQGEQYCPLAEPLADGRARAGRIGCEMELIGGQRARGEVGDYKIYNSHIELIVRSTDKPGVCFNRYSGNLIDADRARPPREPGQDNLLGVDQVVSGHTSPL